MKATIKTYAISAGFMAALWLIGCVLFGIAGELILGGAEVGRLSPFASAHLLEEIDEGIYHPLRDPAFIIYILCLSVFAFGAPAYWLGKRAALSHLWVVGLASASLLGLVFVEYRFVLSSTYPSSMLTAAVVAFFAFAIAAALGLLLAYIGAHRAQSANG